LQALPFWIWFFDVRWSIVEGTYVLWFWCPQLKNLVVFILIFRSHGTIGVSRSCKNLICFWLCFSS
jgi:hypothetical protein